MSSGTPISSGLQWAAIPTRLVLNWKCLHPHMRATHYSVLVFLWQTEYLYHDRGGCTPSQETISKAAGVNTRMACKLLRELKAWGLLNWVSGKTRHLPNSYDLAPLAKALRALNDDAVEAIRNQRAETLPKERKTKLCTYMELFLAFESDHLSNFRVPDETLDPRGSRFDEFVLRQTRKYPLALGEATTLLKEMIRRGIKPRKIPKLLQLYIKYRILNLEVSDVEAYITTVRTPGQN